MHHINIVAELRLANGMNKPFVITALYGGGQRFID
jgi:hypothetical protein